VPTSILGYRPGPEAPRRRQVPRSRSTALPHRPVRSEHRTSPSTPVDARSIKSCRRSGITPDRCLTYEVRSVASTR
jgi:hypothetical protein